MKTWHTLLFPAFSFTFAVQVEPSWADQLGVAAQHVSPLPGGGHQDIQLCALDQAGGAWILSDGIKEVQKLCTCFCSCTCTKGEEEDETS